MADARRGDAIADGMCHEEPRAMLLRLAEDYDRIAVEVVAKGAI
jgi:hypothetical protein